MRKTGLARPGTSYASDWSQPGLLVIEHGQGEIGAEVLLALRREFGKSLEWLLTGQE